jgi:hypothetical protein
MTVCRDDLVFVFVVAGTDLTCDGQVKWADLREFAEWWFAGTK